LLAGGDSKNFGPPREMDGKSLKESRNDKPNEITNQSKEI
jgi:hypothetical protein